MGKFSITLYGKTIYETEAETFEEAFMQWRSDGYGCGYRPVTSEGKGDDCRAAKRKGRKKHE